jgi:predicted nucleic acid-binding protein
VTLPPLILDTGILVELARGDLNLMEMVARWDAQGQSMVMSVVAVAAASRASGSKDSTDLLLGIATMDQITVAGLREPEHGITLASVLGRTDLDWGDAHIAALADTALCSILTLDGSHWAAAIRAFDEPLHVIEISDPPAE